MSVAIVSVFKPATTITGGPDVTTNEAVETFTGYANPWEGESGMRFIRWATADEVSQFERNRQLPGWAVEKPWQD